MGNQKISQLTSITGVSPSDILVIVHSGVTYQIPFSGLTSTLAINQNDEANHHAVYSGNNIYVKSEVHEDLTQTYGSRYVYIGHFDVIHDVNYPEKLGIYAGQTSSYNLISGHGDINNYLQLNIINTNSGTAASSDIVATADNGNENSKYIDMGINSSGYDRNSGIIGGQNDAYIYSTGNDLLIGNASVGKQVIIFNGGLDTEANAKLYVHDQGTIGVNTSTYNVFNPPSLQIETPNSTTFNMIQSVGEVDNYLQIAHTNRSGGLSGSTDYVAYNNIDPTNQLAGYIDMGINSTNYSRNNIYPGGEGDSYVFTDSPHLILGSVITGDTKITMFLGGVSESDNAKLILTSNSGHTIIGDLTVSGSTNINNTLVLPNIVSGNTDTKTLTIDNNGNVHYNENGIMTASISGTSKYLLTQTGSTISLNGPKVRDLNNTYETLLWSKTPNQLTENIKIIKNGAMSTATISIPDGVNDQVVVGSGTSTSYYYPYKQIASRRFVARIKVKVDSMGTTPVLGITSVWPGSPYSSFNNTLFYAYVNLTNGTITGLNSSDVTTTTSGFTGCSVGDIIDVELTTNYMEERLFRVSKNNSLLGEVSVRRDYRTGSGDTRLQNHHYIGFIMGDGTYTILENTIHTREPLNPKIMIFGDSMATGIRVRNTNTCWGYLRSKIPYQTSVVAGTSMQQSGALAVLDEVLKIKPEYIVLFVWIDPIYLDYSNPADLNYTNWSTKFNNFVSTIKGAGITPIFTHPQNWAILDPDGGSSTFYKNYLDTYYPSDLKLYIPTSEAFYDSTGFHYNSTTYNWISDQIISIIETNGGFN